MCLYPKFVKNPKYLPNKKNGGRIPPLFDNRLKYVSVGCGRCRECLKQKANEWITRLTYELLENKDNAKFVTLTFSNESLSNLINEFENDTEIIVKKAVRRFCERWRKKYKKQPRHWLITELGHKNTERIHLHGIIWGDSDDIRNIWKYGHVWIGDYVNKETIFYITKYVTKIDTKHKNYIPRIYTSKGIGSLYWKSKFHTWKRKETKEYLRLPNGQRKGLPIYYRNHIFSELQRELLWKWRLDKQKIYVLGKECDISTIDGQLDYMRLLTEEQQINKRLGYGDNSKEWKKQKYKVMLEEINENKKDN